MNRASEMSEMICRVEKLKCDLYENIKIIVYLMGGILRCQIEIKSTVLTQNTQCMPELIRNFLLWFQNNSLKFMLNGDRKWVRQRHWNEGNFMQDFDVEKQDYCPLTMEQENCYDWCKAASQKNPDETIEDHNDQILRCTHWRRLRAEFLFDDFAVPDDLREYAQDLVVKSIKKAIRSELRTWKIEGSKQNNEHILKIIRSRDWDIMRKFFKDRRLAYAAGTAAMAPGKPGYVLAMQEYDEM